MAQPSLLILFSLLFVVTSKTVSLNLVTQDSLSSETISSVTSETAASQIFNSATSKTVAPEIISSVTSETVALTTTDSPSVYEILKKYSLPPGLLPSSVTSYTLSDDGQFVVELENPCYIHFDYLVYYDRKITGKLELGSITELKGIQVQRFFIWFDVDEIRVDLPPNESIYFKVGIINKKLDVGQFESVKDCSAKAVFELPTLLDEGLMVITE